MRRAEGKAVVDYAFHMIVRDLNGQAAIDMDALARRDGVTSFKLFMAYPGVLMVDDATILRALTKARASGALILVHAETGAEIERLVQDALRQGRTAPKYHALTRPPRVEGEAAGRAIALAGQAGAPIYIVHVSSADALEQVQRARARGMPVFGETCPQYLFLSAADYERDNFEGAQFVCSPPLRDAWHQDRLWEGLAQDHLQVVATDHCPFGMRNPPHKLRGRDDFSKIPNGLPGIETRLMLLWDGGVRTGRISMERFVELAAENPARIFGLWPKKGALAVGSDGDLLVWDPDKRVTLSAATHHMRVDYSPYEGRTVAGAPAAVLSRGDVIVEHGIFTGRPGRGRFISRAPGPPLLT
jgi:dihydropyrimidinase